MDGISGAIANSMKVSPRDILFIFFSKLHVMIGVFVIVVTLVTVKTLRTPKTYQVSAAVLIRPIVDSRLTLQTSRFSVAPISQEDVNTEIKLMVSKELMRNAAKKLGLMKKKQNRKPKKKRLLVEWGIEYEASHEDKVISYIRSELDISAVSMSNMIQLTKRGDDPDEISKILETIIKCYIDLHIKAHKTAGTAKFYSQEIATYERNILDLEKALKEYQTRYFIINSEEQELHNLKLLQLLQESLSILRANIAEQQSKISALKKNLQEKGIITSMIKEYRQSQVLAELTKVYVPLLVERERIGLLYPKSSIEYKDMDRQTKKFKKEILKKQRELLKGMELDLNALVNKKEALISEIERIKKEAEIMAEKEIQRNRLMREIDKNRKNYKLYGDKLQEARITEQREESKSANVFVSNWPSPPSKPVAPNVKVGLMLGLLAGIIAGIGAALAAFYLDHTIKRPEELERFSGAPMLSSIGVIRAR